MKCSNCGGFTEGGYCDCMIVGGEFKGAHWRKDDEREDDNMGCKSKKIHVIKDESLGGIEREYVEVDRKAEVGELVIYHYDGRIAKVISDKEGINTAVETYLSTALSFGAPILEPTDIVHIDGEMYRMVERKAEVGERVIVTDDWYNSKSGTILYIIDGSDFGFSADRENEEVFFDHPDNTEGKIRFIPGNFYRVLVPADSGIVAAEPPQSQADIIANLVRRVSQLESELTGAKRDIETWAQEVEGLRYTNTELYSRLGHVEQDTDDLDEKVEMVIDDIVTLDERTNLSQEITISVAELTKLIGGARR